MKSVRLSGLAASTALALILALSSQPGQAQSTSDGPAQVATPMPGSAAQSTDKPAAAKDAQQSDATMAKPAAAPADATNDMAKKDAAEDAAKDAGKTAMTPADASASAKAEDKTEAKTEAKSEPKAEPTAESNTNTASQPADASSKAATSDTAAPATADTKAETAAAPTADTKPDAKTEAATEAKPAAETKTEAKTEPTAEPKPETKTDTAAQPTEAPAKAAAAPAAAPAVDTAVVDALKSMITGRLDRYVPRREDRAGVEAFYKQRDYKPLWLAGDAADARAKAAIAYLASVAADGLDPSDYPTPDFAAATGADQLAAAELKLTNAVLIYAHDAQVGRVHFTRVGSDISFKLDEPEPAAVLAKMANTQDVAAALDGYNPPQPGFKALKAKLAQLRKGEDAGTAEGKKVVRVASGRTLRPGMRDPRVVQLRKRLKIAGDKTNRLYDASVVEAVKAFQKKADIGVDGMVGPATVNALNGQHGLQIRPANPIETVIVNMERWRWLPRKLGNAQNTYVVVNVPNYTLSLMHDGKVYWKTDIVVGKPSKATPMTSAEMKYITVNPTWNVPPSIIENEYLPALEQDPTVLDRYGLKIRQSADGTVHIWQPPGAGNALGRIRFNFPNKFLVYQHDTPDKYLFKRTKRAYSHGCMRVQDPVEYATKLLSLELPQDKYSPARIESMFGGSEININFPRPIPVHLTYQTAFVDQNGKLQFREDVYGRDARMMAILENARERRVAYVPVQRPPNTSAKPVRMPVGMFPGDNGPSYGGPNIFDWLFGDQPQRPRYRRPNFIGPHARDNGRYSRR